VVPFQNFETGDGWIVIACPKETLWQRLCAALGREDLAEDASFASFAARERNRAELVETLEAELRGRSSAELLQTLTAARVPCAPVNGVAAALADAQVVAREALISYEHPVLGDVSEIASPFRFDGCRREASRGPLRGEDTARLLREHCGYSEQRISELQASGVFGQTHPAGEVGS
jgi:crotonobetainyl-CoA:carnitine CoA-transferase CaiB-like acyl-CoA transferase